MFGAPPLSCANPTNVGQKTLAGYNSIQAKFPNQPLFLTEAGWPSSYTGSAVNSPGNVNNGQVCSTAGNVDQKAGVQSIVNAFRAAGKPLNVFSSFREAWKGSSSTSFEEYWGFCSGSYPYNCDNAPR
jgi:exo-beta-1,3-glucanase (GH17 family)